MWYMWWSCPRKECIFKHDRSWFEEAIINIIKNAIDHTDYGGVIEIELSESPIYKRIIISDNGEGIDDADILNIFKRFYTSKVSTSNEHIGIGLSLSKSIIEYHDGTIEVRSKKNIGTTFTITLVTI